MDEWINYNSQPQLSNLLSKKNLIYGDVGVGKTTFIINFLHYLSLRNIELEEITILDFAPSAIFKENLKIGGTILEVFNFLKESNPMHNEFIDFFDKLSVNFSQNKIQYQFLSPRSSSTTEIEVLKKSMKNFRNSNELLYEYIENPSRFLLINDVGIYLHLGDMKLVRICIELAETSLITAYYGENLVEDYGSNISWRERIMINILKKHTQSFLFT